LFPLPVSAYHPDLPSFPTRRSSDLGAGASRRNRLGRVARAMRVADGEQSLDDLRVLGRDVVALAGIRREVDEELLVLGRQLVRRSEEHTSELQSRENLVCRLLLEKK